MQKSILPVLAVMGANPAWQKTLWFEHLVPGGVNRARALDAYPSGKGVNCCRAARCHGRSRTRLFHFSGGDTGARLDAGLRADGFDVVSIPLGGETRSCTTCIDDASSAMTELIEPCPGAGPRAVAEMLSSLDRALEECEVLVIVGTLPGNTDPGLYREAVRLAAAHNRLTVIDAYQNIAPALDTAPRGRTFVKINAAELAALCGGERDIVSALAVFRRRFPGISAAVTDGPADAFLDRGDRIFRFGIPVLEKIASPLGCGDTASAVLATELQLGNPPEQAFASALSAAAANTQLPRAGCFDPSLAARLRAGISIEEVRRANP